MPEAPCVGAPYGHEGAPHDGDSGRQGLRTTGTPSGGDPAR